MQILGDMAHPDPPLGRSQLLISVLRDVWCYTRLRDEEQKAWPEEVLGHGSWDQGARGQGAQRHGVQGNSTQGYGAWANGPRGNGSQFNGA